MSNNQRTHKLNIASSNNSIPIWGPNFTDLGYDTILAQNVEQTLVVPGGVTVAIVRYTPGTSVYVTNGTTPITPPTGSFTATSNMLSPTAFWVQPGDTIRFLAQDSDSRANINFYDNQGI